MFSIVIPLLVSMVTDLKAFPFPSRSNPADVSKIHIYISITSVLYQEFVTFCLFVVSNVAMCGFLLLVGICNFLFTCCF